MPFIILDLKTLDTDQGPSLASHCAECGMKEGAVSIWQLKVMQELTAEVGC